MGSPFPSVTGLVGMDGRPVLDPRVVRLLDAHSAALQHLLELVEKTHAGVERTQSAIPGIDDIRRELEATGSAPLNVTALRGQLGEPQPSSAPHVAALPSLSDISYEDGSLIETGGVVYRRNRTTEPGSWDSVTNVGSVSSVSSSSTSLGLSLTTTNPTTTPAIALSGTPTRATLGAKQTAGAPYANDGYVTVTDQSGNSIKLMTTA